MATTVTSKGQVTIPKQVRDLLGIEPGSKVDFERGPDGRIVLVRVDGKQRPSRFARPRRQGAWRRRHHGADARRRIDLTLVDANVLLDLVTDDPRWAEWSIAKLEEAALRGALSVNDVVYAELSVRYDRVEALEAMLDNAAIAFAATRRVALFLAGKAFAHYRRAGGARTGAPPDFIIGAHAAVVGLPLLTRDGRRYRAYFPTLELIAP